MSKKTSQDPKFNAGDKVAWQSQNGGDRREGIVKAFVPAGMALDVAYPGIMSPYYAQPDAMPTSRVDRYVIAVEPRAAKFGKTSRGRARLYAPNKGVIEREPGNPIKVSAIPLFEVFRGEPPVDDMREASLAHPAGDFDQQDFPYLHKHDDFCPDCTDAGPCYDHRSLGRFDKAKAEREGKGEWLSEDEAAYQADEKGRLEVWQQQRAARRGKPATQAEAVAILEGYGDEGGRVPPEVVRSYETKIANGALTARVTEPIPAHLPQDLTVFGPNDYLEAHSPTHDFIKEEREKAMVDGFPVVTASQAPVISVEPEDVTPDPNPDDPEERAYCDECGFEHAVSGGGVWDHLSEYEKSADMYPDKPPVFVFEGSVTEEQIERIKAEASKPGSRPIVLEGGPGVRLGEVAHARTFTDEEFDAAMDAVSIEANLTCAKTEPPTVNGAQVGLPLPFPIHPPDRMGKLSRYPLVRSDFEIGEQLVSLEMRETIRTWPTGTAVMYNGARWKVFGYPKAFLNRSRPMLVIIGDETHPKEWQVVGPELLWRDMGKAKPASNGPNVPRFDVNTGAMLGRNGLPVIGDNSNKRTGQKRAFKKTEPIAKPKTEKPDQPSLFGDLKAALESGNVRP